MDKNTDKIIRERFHFYGNVQGVGFRYRAAFAAELIGATGWICNNADGSVTMEIQGIEIQIEKVLMRIRQGRYIRIADIDVYMLPLVADEENFIIR